jgi:hypothetical protein
MIGRRNRTEWKQSSSFKSEIGLDWIEKCVGALSPRRLLSYGAGNDELWSSLIRQCQRMTLPADTPIDQHIKRKRVCKFVTSFGVSALVKRDSLWQQGIQGHNLSSECQRNKIPTPLVSQYAVKHSSEYHYDGNSKQEVVRKRWKNARKVRSSNLLSKSRKMSCKIITSSICNRVQCDIWLVLSS